MTAAVAAADESHGESASGPGWENAVSAAPAVAAAESD